MSLQTDRISGQLYRRLVDERDKLLEIVRLKYPHETQFQFDLADFESYQSLYSQGCINLSMGNSIPKNKTRYCYNCRKHFYIKRPKIETSVDIEIGLQLEQVFKNTLNDYFAKYEPKLVCEKADVERLNMPDFKICDRETGKVIIYFEFKCIFKPFLSIAKNVDPKYMCYSHSMTLDSDVKLTTQLGLIKSKGLSESAVYVYWYDIPCMKGFFWAPSSLVKEKLDNTIQYARNIVDGDYEGKTKRGHTDKIYLPLHEMRDFSSFVAKVIDDHKTP